MVDRIIDLRSDTVTRPTAAMREEMAGAAVGDDVYGEDPTVRRLEEVAARRVGSEAALFMPTGTMANQVAVHLHTRPGDEVLIEATSHSLDYELSGMAVLSAVQPRPIPGDRGVLAPDDLVHRLGSRPYYVAPTGLVVLENTHNMAGGRIYPPELFAAVVEVCREHDVPVHLDGARLFNAAVASGRSPAELSRGCTSVMFSLSKGLSAPAGSLLCGAADLMEEARRVRKLFGGGMRQVGILAAAGLVALDRMVDRLADDHANARRLADGLQATGKIELAFGHVDTNILVVDVRATGRDAASFRHDAGERGVRCLATGPHTVRFVTHREVTADDIDAAVERIAAMVAG